MPYGGNFSWGNNLRRSSYNFTGGANSNSKLAWGDIDISQNARTITPKNRSGANGIGAYNQDTMMNLSSFTGSNERIDNDRNWGANSGIISGSSTKQITALSATKPNIFWNMHSYDYSTNKNENFSKQNGTLYFNFWRIGQAGSNVVNDIAQNTKSTQHLLNHSNEWDDSLFTIAQSNQGHGNKFNKVVVSTNSQDFNVSRPLIYQDVGGLPRQGGDVYSKEAPGDGGFQAADFDYYLNYYPKYNSSRTNIPRSKSGYDWGAINSTSGGSGYSAYRGYSAVFKEKVNITTSN